jgi:hypothetical protein
VIGNIQSVIGTDEVKGLGERTAGLAMSQPCTSRCFLRRVASNTGKEREPGKPWATLDRRGSRGLSGGYSEKIFEIDREKFENIFEF